MVALEGKLMTFRELPGLSFIIQARVHCPPYIFLFAVLRNGQSQALNLNTERSYKRHGHAPLKHSVGFLCSGGKPE